MKHLGAFLAALVLSVSAFAAPAPNVISVSGTGRIEVDPNLAIVDLAVVTRARDAKEAQASNAVESERLTGLLFGEFRIEKNDIRTTGYSVRPEYRDYESREIIGYIVTNSLAVRVQDLSAVGNLLDRAGESNAVQVNHVQFGLSNQREYELKALKLAVEDSREKAEVIAAATGRTVLKVRRVSQDTYRVEAKREQADARAPGTEVHPGIVVVSADLTVEYLF